MPAGRVPGAASPALRLPNAVIPSRHPSEPELRCSRLLTSFVTEEIAAYGYLAIFLLMVLESACVPIPSEVTMLFGGALASAAFLGDGAAAPEPCSAWSP